LLWCFCFSSFTPLWALMCSVALCTKTWSTKRTTSGLSQMLSFSCSGAQPEKIGTRSCMSFQLQVSLATVSMT